MICGSIIIILRMLRYVMTKTKKKNSWLFYQLQARTEIPLSEQEIKAEKRIIYKNVLLISISFLLLFVAFESMSKLQSSINVVSGWGFVINLKVAGDKI
jgi:hypothetical protein